MSEPITRYPYFTVDHQADCAYIYVTDMAIPVTETKSITPQINADYDADGNVIGVEFLSLQVDFGEIFRLRRVEP